MNARPNRVAVVCVLLAVVGVLGLLPFLKGAFYIGKHEGDTLHLAELVLRMASGQTPHIDFMTPIGALAIAPMVLFVKMGAGLGHAIFWSQLLVAIVLLPFTLRVAFSRLTGIWPYAYGAFVMLLCVALVHGEAERAVSISMHYNRWAWAVAYIIVPLAMLAPRRDEHETLDGLIIGLGLAALVLTKVTYFVALAPGLLVAMILRRQWKGIAVACVAGLAVAVAVTGYLGLPYWLAYLDDLRTVATSDVRPQPGQGFGVVVAAPAYMGSSLTLLAVIIFLRQAGRLTEGAALLFLMPGLFYITYQNFGNDPQWLILLAVLVFAVLPDEVIRNGRGWNITDSLRIAGILAVAFGTPSLVNLAFSPFRHLATSDEKRVPLLPGLPQHQDILTLEQRLYQVDLQIAGDTPGMPLAAYRDRSDRKSLVSLKGEALPECFIETGMHAWFETVAKDLTDAGYAGKRILGTDLFNLYWAFGDFRTVPGAAPWYYGGLSGMENADYVVIPLCPIMPQIRSGMVKDMEEGGWTINEVRRTDLYILVEVTPPVSRTPD